ncbi:MAG TPA: glycosyltransferase family 9 protein [Vicinamibacterales bacterium]|nr:glycosyltransferase family 9 protein [Vicinamibacterales bacterium]
MSDAPARGASGARTPPRFLIVRLGSLGDIIHAIPAAAALRAALPSAVIDWAVDPRYVDLIKMVTAVNNPVPLDPRAGMIRLFATMSELRRRKYKVAIDFQGLIKSATIARLAGAKRVLGFPQAHVREQAARAFYTDSPETVRAAHVVYKNLELVAALGIDVGEPAFPLNVPKTAAVQDVEARFGGAPFALINPGAAWPNKRWPPERYGGVAAAIRERFGWPSLVLWGPKEQALAETVVQASNGAAVLAPPTSIVDLFGIAKAARIAVSGDTGPLHIAAAVGTPVVALFGPTRADRNGPWDGADVVVERTAHCECLYERECRRSAQCIDEIPLDEVVAAVVRRVEAHG